MKKLLTPLVTLLWLGVTPASATEFTLDSISVALNTTDPGLVLFKDILLTSPVSFDLDGVGDSEVIDLFKVGTKEQAFNLDDLIPYGIKVNFDFSTPSPGFEGTAEGITGAIGFGYVAWDNPLYMSFGNYGVLGAWLSHETFGLPGSATVKGTFKLVKADGGSPNRVPEPTSALLFGLGAVAISTLRRAKTSGETAQA
jgi:hypothetical protein